MARWSLLVADTDGTIRGEWVRARGLGVTFDLSSPSKVQWSSDGDDPGAMLAHEITSDLLLYRNDDLMFRGRVGTTGDDIDEDTHTVKWSAVDYRGMLDRRLMSSPSSWNGWDQGQIAWGFIQAAQAAPEGNLGITDASTPTGRMRIRAYEWGKPVGQAIQQLSEVIDGFDWDITPDLEFVIWYPERGASRTWAAVFGDTIRKVSRKVDTGDYATDVFATGGQDASGNPVRAIKSVVGPRGPGGRWEKAMSWSDVTRQGTLDDHAETAVADASVIRPTYDVTVKPGRWTPDDAWLGDTTRLVIQSGRVAVDTSGRILAIKIDVDDNGEETVTLSYGRRPVDLGDRLGSMADNLAALNRR